MTHANEIGKHSHHIRFERILFWFAVFAIAFAAIEFQACRIMHETLQP